MEMKSPGRPRMPFEDAAKDINRQAGLYLSEGQQKGLAAGLFAGTVLIAAGVAWAIGHAYRRHLR